jgi:hypothetical protein
MSNTASYKAKQALAEFKNTVNNALTNFYNSLDSITESAAAAEVKPKVQARIRDGVLHLQYGTPGSYKKASVELSYKDAIAFEKLSATSPSFAGSSSYYVVGSVLTDGRIRFGGFDGVIVSSPFWTANAAPKGF